MVLPFLLLALFLLPIPALAADFNNVTFHCWYDGDTCMFTIPGVHPLFGEKISVRIAGIDTPEIKSKREQGHPSPHKVSEGQNTHSGEIHGLGRMGYQYC